MIKYLSLFSGIGAFEKAMNNLEISHELIGFSEIDKHASQSYCAIHGFNHSLNLGDITKIDEKQLPKVDFITYGFPCQDISISGKKKGLFNEDGSRTRSGLFFDAARIIEHCKPKVAVAENVKNLTGNTMKEQFELVLNTLEEIGYNNYWKVLNASDFNVPHERERVFIVSIRKDIDSRIFQFPEPYELKYHMIDYLDKEIPEESYVDTERARKVIQELGDINEEPKHGLKVIGNLWADNGHNSMAGRVYEVHGTCPTLGASNFQRVKFIYDPGRQKIRPLLPSEAFRLLGFSDVDYISASGVCSKTQLLKQAGNSIVVDVAEELLCMLFDEDGNFFI